MRNHLLTLTGYVGAGRPSPLMREQYSEAQQQIILEGLLAKKAYDMIARDLRMNENDPRPSARGPSLYYYVAVSEHFGSVEKYLRDHGVYDDAEVAKVLEFYDSTNGGQPWSDNKKPSMKPSAREKKVYVAPPRAMKHDPLGERQAIEKIVADGMVARHSYATMADTATERQIPLDLRQVEKLVNTWGGPKGFLEHMGYSGKRAAELAVYYNN